MSNETDTPTTTAQPTQPGPDLLTERTLAGIFVHLIGLGTGFIGTSFIYLISDSDFSRKNARNATNWQLLYWGTHLLWFCAFGLLFLFDAVFPDSTPFNLLFAGLFLGLAGSFFVIGILFLLQIAFVFVAFAKAIFGTAWEYPIAPDIVGWIQSRTSDSPSWWLPVAAYALVVPLLFGNLAWLANGGPDSDVLFFASFVLLLGSMFVSVFAVAALYRDACHLNAADVGWQPNWIAYIGTPIIAGMLAYIAVSVNFGSEIPSGVAVYVFMFALWIATIIYLFKRYKYVRSA